MLSTFFESTCRIFFHNFQLIKLKGHPICIKRRQDTQHNNTQPNDIQHSDTQHNDTQPNDIQHTDTQHNDIQHNNKYKATLSTTTLSMMAVLFLRMSFMPSVVLFS